MESVGRGLVQDGEGVVALDAKELRRGDEDRLGIVDVTARHGGDRPLTVNGWCSASVWRAVSSTAPTRRQECNRRCHHDYANRSHHVLPSLFQRQSFTGQATGPNQVPREVASSISVGAETPTRSEAATLRPCPVG